jgi:capsular polysaccharide biosynthesis protein
VAWLRDRIESHFGPLAVAPASQQIFVSRAHAHAGNRVLVNRAEIEAMAVAQGFSFVYPEEITLLQQFSVFAGARRIVGEYGSALHTAMFSQPGTLICALRGDGIHPGFAQSGIATALGHDIGYVIGTNVAESWDFRIEPSHFAAAMRCISGGAPLAR